MQRIGPFVLVSILVAGALILYGVRSGAPPGPSSTERPIPSDSGAVVPDVNPDPSPALSRSQPASRSEQVSPSAVDDRRGDGGGEWEPLLDDLENVDRGEMRALTRAMLADSIEAYLPGHKLSSDELDRLADSTSSLREAQTELRELPEDPAFATERRRLTETIADSIAEFVEIMDMDPAEFTEAIQPGIGIDSHDPDEVVPEGEFIVPRARSEVDE